MLEMGKKLLDDSYSFHLSGLYAAFGCVACWGVDRERDRERERERERYTHVVSNREVESTPRNFHNMLTFCFAMSPVLLFCSVAKSRTIR